MKASIVTIGDEILIGQVVDSNSAFIAAELNRIGISVSRIISISDKREEIFSILNELIPVADVIILTGGLGPTSDDITKEALADYFKTKLVFNHDAMEYISGFLSKRNVSLNELNRNQAFLPADCLIIPNHSGTAMGMWFKRNNSNIISLPGVPFEMKELMSKYIMPRLAEIYPLPAIEHKTVLTTGIAESVMAERIAVWEKNLPPEIKLAYLPSPGLLRLRLSTISKDTGLTKEIFQHHIGELKNIIPEAIFGYDNDSLEGVTGRLLKANSSTLSLAESCTGGYISHLITSVPGSSSYFRGGITAYSNEIKICVLKVNESLLNQFGAVSGQVVIQMAENVRILFKTGYSISVSGIAGPDGGTPDKPVGTVWIAVTSHNFSVAKEFRFGDNRERNIRRASVTALNMLRLLVEGRHKVLQDM